MTAVTYACIYFAVTYVVGFLWTCLDARLDHGHLRSYDVNEALIVALIAPFWVPIRIIVETLRLLRAILM